ncbi:MAG: family 78 glycoside hydrolase catalytic domain [Sphingobacteriaceae bacterium]
MNNKLMMWSLWAVFSVCFTSRGWAANGEPIDLKSEHLVNPLGIDAPAPRLSWKMSDTRSGAKQTAYQIQVGTDSLALVEGRELFWDSGKESKADNLIRYQGPALSPQTKYFWKVGIWDHTGEKQVSSVNSFETGKMGKAVWKGAWIGDGQDINHQPAPYFRKEFQAEKEIQSARAYIAVGGLYELSINGQKIGDHQLDPMYTRFDRRTLYVVHDVTQAINRGGNAIGVLLGNGWYNHQSLAVWNFDNAPWRARPTFCMDLHITYTDGTEETIATERDWKTSSGPLIFNSIYTAEHYDARLEQEGWNQAGFDDRDWSAVHYRTAPSSQVVSQQMVPIRLIKPYSPEKVVRIDDTTTVFDMGQNMAGVTKINVQGPRGTVIKIKHGERLHDDGRIDLSNIDVYYRGDNDLDPFQTDVLILSGNKEDEFMPRFNYKGFRYVEVTSSQPIDIGKDQITAYFMHSDVDPVGNVQTSSALVNKLWEITNNAYLSNLMGYPTDCPQREKNGWTGDGHLAIETALYNFDGITVYEKWLADHRDEQQPNGVLPDIIPTGGWGYGTANGLDWTSTIAIIPWELYRYYGDSKALEENYESIKRYVDMVDRRSTGGLTTFGRGDWVPVKSTSDLELTSSVYFYVDAHILARTAELLGKQEDQQRYAALAATIKDAINDKFLNKSNGMYASGTQTELSVPLHWGVVPEEFIPLVASNLNKKVEETDFHLDVGVLGAKAVLNALNENGYSETAYRLAVQDTYPSWGWWAVNGATTLLENWDLDATRDISDNHMMFGEIGGWFFKSIGGILPDEKQPGFKHIILKPIFPKGLEHSAVSHQSPYGEIVVNWERKGNSIELEAVVPANSTATFFPPENALDQDTLALSAGSHHLKISVDN